MAVDPTVVRVVRLPHGEGLPLPERASRGAAGVDLRAAVEERCIIGPGERVLVPTGLVLEIPPDWEGQVRPRSGLALRHGISMLNSPGTIDSDYRGEVKVILANLGDAEFVLERGDRIAQLVLARVANAVLVEVETLTETSRGGGGFGSSGVD